MRRKKPTKEVKEPFLNRELMREFLLFLVKLIGAKVEDKFIKALLIGGIAAASNFYSIDEEAMLNRDPPAVQVQMEKAQ